MGEKAVTVETNLLVAKKQDRVMDNRRIHTYWLLARLDVFSCIPPAGSWYTMVATAFCGDHFVHYIRRKYERTVLGG